MNEKGGSELTSPQSPYDLQNVTDLDRYHVAAEGVFFCVVFVRGRALADGLQKVE